MSEQVKIIGQVDVYGQDEYMVVNETGFELLDEWSGYERAKSVAWTIEARASDPALRGWGGLELS